MEQLLQKQTELQGRIARAFENLKKLGQANITKGSVQSRLDNLNENWRKFEANHEQLLTMLTKETATYDYFVKNHLALVEESFLLQKAEFVDIMMKILDKEKQVMPAPTNTTAPAKSATKSLLNHIDLPRFSGSYQSWTRFKELFTDLVLRDEGLSQSERMHYLLNALSGEPAEYLQGIPVTGENFIAAWNRLVSKYENKRSLVNSQFDTLTAIKPMQTNTAQELKRVFHGTLNVVSALKALGRPIGEEADWLVYTTVERLSNEVLSSWESSLGGSTEPPSFDKLKIFLANQIRTLEAVEAKMRKTSTKSTPKQASQWTHKNARSHQVTKKEGARLRCTLCQGSHYILFCEAFKSKTPMERKELLLSRNLCLNCLGKHSVAECFSEKRCQKCLGRHHSILHDAFLRQSPLQITSHFAEVRNERTESTMLATAQLFASDQPGEKVPARALIDPGSEVTLITENLVQLLRLPRQQTNMTISGVGAGYDQRVRGKVTLTLISRTSSDFSIRISALVLRQLTSYQPHDNMKSASWQHIYGLELADPNYTSQGRLYLILGVDVYGDIIEEGLRKGARHAPIAQKTTLGWIILGRSNTSQHLALPRESRAVSLHCRDNDLVSLIQRFWKQEELPPTPIPLSAEDEHCENFYRSTQRRTNEGRYMVRLPIKNNLPEFTNSKTLAIKVQLAMERRFSRNSDFAKLYKEFRLEYEQLDHMEKLSTHQHTGTHIEYFLPHHGVWKEHSTTTRLRVVFNGSQIAKDGNSLNDFLFAGPNLLPELSDILLRWRKHKYVLSADIEKMYRQILVDPRDRALQQIIWRTETGGSLHTYQLKTVTYGLTCAPFLAIRTLQQLAADEEHHYPLGAQTLRTDCYVDDVLTGDSTLTAAKQRQIESASLCKAGGFRLRKWAANSPELIPTDNYDDPVDKQLHWPIEDDRMILGITWKPREDAFTYQVMVSTTSRTITKRTVLSQIARLFDPLGWISPLTIIAKIFIQNLWLLALDWDTPLPPAEERRWEKIQRELPTISQIKIPRWMHMDTQGATIEIHGFADASERAKAAVVYLRVISESSQVTVSLVTSKTKVASLKPERIARKELCAAKMLTELVTHVKKVLKLDEVPIHLWSDSKVTLAWIQGHPRKWSQFVANRVSDIQTALPQAVWHHIDGLDNPADCASRGMTPSQLIDFDLWWQGPARLTATSAIWERSSAYEETDQEFRKSVTMVAGHSEEQVWSFLYKYSSLSKLLRVTAWCQRWIRHCSNQSKETSPYLTTAELSRARSYWIATTQRAAYCAEIEQLLRGNNVSKKSCIAKLNPIFDKDRQLRVGGRLKHALLSYEEKHPLILPPNSYLTRLIIDHTHKLTLHGGVQLTLGMIRRSFWIPRGRSLVKGWIHKCTRCLRWRATTAQQQMGNLPRTRITPSRPFFHTGLDYAGPILLRTAPGRGHKAYKGYIAIFVCFSTRAIHMEAVSDYTATAFLAAFRRFVSRRGICSTLTSDCGSNFTGAAAELRHLLGSATKEHQQIAATLASEGTQWFFNPPAAPHFGGLWEAAVKSVKFHLKRVIGDTTLTFEEMSTFLAQTEACLNSRPLQPLTDDPDDLTALTPGHFLIGAPLCAIPEPSLTEISPSRLTRWQLLQRMQQHFWKRWAQEYLQTLQHRGKWASTRPTMKVGDLCLIKSETLPPTRWPLARIIDTHPGDDNLTRVVTLKTATSTLKRPITKLILLSLSDP